MSYKHTLRINLARMKKKALCNLTQLVGGLEDVFDYLLSIGVDYTGVDGNLILDNIKGRNPSVSLVQKLLNAGIEPNSKTFINKWNRMTFQPNILTFTIY